MKMLLLLAITTTQSSFLHAKEDKSDWVRNIFSKEYGSLLCGRETDEIQSFLRDIYRSLPSEPSMSGRKILVENLITYTINNRIPFVGGCHAGLGAYEQIISPKSFFELIKNDHETLELSFKITENITKHSTDLDIASWCYYGAKTQNFKGKKSKHMMTQALTHYKNHYSKHTGEEYDENYKNLMMLLGIKKPLRFIITSAECREYGGYTDTIEYSIEGDKLHDEHLYILSHIVKLSLHMTNIVVENKKEYINMIEKAKNILNQKNSTDFLGSEVSLLALKLADGLTSKKHVAEWLFPDPRAIPVWSEEIKPSDIEELLKLSKNLQKIMFEKHSVKKRVLIGHGCSLR